MDRLLPACLAEFNYSEVEGTVSLDFLLKVFSSWIESPQAPAYPDRIIANFRKRKVRKCRYGIIRGLWKPEVSDFVLASYHRGGPGSIPGRDMSVSGPLL